MSFQDFFKWPQGPASSFANEQIDENEKWILYSLESSIDGSLESALISVSNRTVVLRVSDFFLLELF